MRIILKLISNLSVLTLLTSCSVISPKIRSEAEPPVAFKTLVAKADNFKGSTVILGGYILETSNRESETIIKVLQMALLVMVKMEFGSGNAEGGIIIHNVVI